MLNSWWKQLQRKISTRRARTASAPRQRRRGLRMETLEERLAPAAGDLDLSFGGNNTGFVTPPFLTVSPDPELNDSARSLVVDAQGRSVVAGYVDEGSNADFAVARYTAAGILDTSFGVSGKVVIDLGGSDTAYSIAVDGAGRYIVAGQSGTSIALVRLLDTGTLDTDFDTDGIVTTTLGSSASGQSVIVDGNDYVVAGSAIGANSDFALLRYTSTGALDTAFGSGGIVTTSIGTTDRAYSVALHGTSYVVAGETDFGGSYDFALARYTSAGVLDTTFGVGGGDGDGVVVTSVGVTDSARSVVVDNGRYVVAGHAFIGGSNGYDLAMVRYTSTGALDNSFDGDGRVTTNIGTDNYAHDLVVDEGGNYVVVGSAYNGTGDDFAVVRYTPNGTPDPVFGGGDGIVTTLAGTTAYAVALDAIGDYVVAGESTGAAYPDFALATYLAGGTLRATLTGGHLVISDTADRPNQLTITRSGGNYVISDATEEFRPTTAGTLSNASKTLTVLASAVTQITVNGAGDSDTLTLDFTTGSVVPASGLTFNGGESSGHADGLKLIGYTDDVSVNHTAAEAGSVHLASLGLASIAFADAESLTLGGTNTTLAISMPAGANTATLGDDGGTGDPDGNTTGTSALSAASFAYTQFTNPGGTLGVSRGNTGDDLTVQDLAASGMTASLTIGGPTTPFDQVSFTGLVTLAAGKSLAVHAASISTSAALSTSGAGTITLTADDQAIGATVSAAGVVTLQNQTANRPINLGAEASGALSLTGTELNLISAGTLRIGNAGSGAISIDENISPAGTGTLDLRTGATIGDTGGLISETNLILSAAGGVNLPGPGNAVTNLAGSAGSGGFTFGDASGGLTVITIDGVPGITTTNGAVALAVHAGLLTVTTAINAGNANVTLTADSMAIGATVNAGSQTATLRPLSEARPLYLGTSEVAGALSLSDSELDNVTAATLVLGSATGGAVEVAGAFNRSAATAIEVVSATTITFSTGNLSSNGGNIKLTGASVAPNSSGTEVALTSVGAPGTLSFGIGTDLAIAVNGASNYTQLDVAGVVNLTGVDLAVSGSYTPTQTDTFVIVLNDSNDAVIGTFTGLVEGAIVNVNGRTKRLTYLGGDGNDVALEPVRNLSATVDGSGNLSVADTVGADNTLTLRVVGGMLTLADAAERFQSAPSGWTLAPDRSSISILASSFTGSISINAAGGTDTLTVNHSGGDAVPDGGVVFNGGESSGDHDALILTGYDVTTATVTHTGAESGTVVLGGLGTVAFTQIEPLTLAGDADNLVLNLPAGADSITLGDDGGSQDSNGNTANTSALYDSTGPTYSFEFTEFTNPSDSLTINRGSATDDLTVLSLVTSGMTGGLVIGSETVPFDQVSFTGPVTLAAGKSLAVHAASISTSAALSTSGAGTITFTADDQAINSTISATSVTLRNLTANRVINLGAGSDGAGFLALTGTELDRVSATTLIIGRNDALAAGTIQLQGQVDVSSGTSTVANLQLVTGASITDNTGPEQANLKVSSLSLTAGTGIVGLDIDVDTLALASTTSGGISIDLRDSNNSLVTVTTATAGAGDIVFTATSGGGTNTYQFDSVVASNGTINISKSVGGNISLGNLSTAATAGKSITVDVGTGGTNALGHLAGTTIQTNGGLIRLIANRMSLLGTAIIPGTANVLLRPVTAAESIQIGGATAGAALSLLEAQLQTITTGAGSILVGNGSTAGTISVVGALDLGSRNLSLFTTNTTPSAISDATPGQGGNRITANELVLGASGGIDVTTAVNSLTGSGTSLRVDEADNVTIAGSGLTVQSAVLGTTGTSVYELGNNNVISDTANVTLNPGVTLDLRGGDETIGALNGSGTVHNSVVNTVTLTVGGGTFSGLLENGTGTLALTKSTGDTLTLSGTHTYSGATTVSDGTLLLNGSIAASSLTTVQSGGTLGGTGTTGPLTIDDGGSHKPGTSPGITTVTGNYLENGTLEVEFLNHTGGPGSGHDQVQVIGSGSVTLGATATLATPYLVGGTFNPAFAQVFVIIDNDGSTAGDTTGTFVGLADGDTVTIDGKTLKLFYHGGDGNDVVLVSTNGTPTTLYIDDTFTGTPGKVISDADTGTTGDQGAVLGVNAFTSFAAALAANPTFNGTLVVNTGSYAEAVNLSGTRSLRVTGPDAAGTVAIDSLAGASTAFVQIIGASTLTIGDASDATLASAISGTGELIKTGGGVLTLSGANSGYTGNVAVYAGTVKIGHTDAFGADNTAVTKVVVGSGATVDFNGVIDAVYGYTIAGSGVGGLGALVNTGGVIATDIRQASNIKLAADATIGGTGNWALLTTGYAPTTLDLAGFTLTKVGGNTFSLVNATVTAGAIQINEGTLSQTASNKPGGHDLSNVAVTLANTAGATLALNNLNLIVGSLSGGGTGGGNVALGTGTLTVGNLATDTTYAGIIGGTGGLVKTGGGGLTLSGPNTYSGGTTIGQGTIIGSHNTAFGTATIILGNAGTGSNPVAVLLANNVDITNPVTVSASGSGTATLGTSGTGVAGNATTFGGLLTLNRATTISSTVADRLGIDGKVTGPVGILTVSGGKRTSFLSTANDFAGDIVLAGSGTILQASVGSAAEVIPNTSSVEVGSGATFQLAGTAGSTETINALIGSGTVTRNVGGTQTLLVGFANGDGTFSGNINNGSGVVALAKTGSGTQILSGAGNSTGGIAVNQGIVRLQGNRSFNAGYFTNIDNVPYSVATGATLSLEGDYISRSSSIYNINGGTLNTQAPGGNWLYINRINFDTAPGTISGTSGFRTGNFFDPVFTVAAAASGSLISSNFALVDQGATTNQLTLDVADGIGATDLSISGLISDLSGFTGLNVRKSGTGTLKLDGLNTYTGSVQISQGVLVAGASNTGAGALGAFNASPTKVNVQAGGTLDINGRASTGVDFFYGVTIAGTGSAGQGALVNNGANGGVNQRQTPNITLADNATIGGTGDLYMINGGYAANTLDLAGFTLTKTGTNTLFLLNTTVNAGTLQINQGTVSQTNVASNLVNVNVSLADVSSATLALGGFGMTIASLSGGGTTGGNVTLGGNTLTVGNANSTSYGGAISGAGGLTTIGFGSLTLSGSSGYSGATTVSGGTLLVTGSIVNSSTTVQSGATLGGGGTFGPVTINAGGTHSPGTSPGIDTVTGNYVENGALVIEFADTSGVAGSGHDQVQVLGNGSVTIGTTATLATPYLGTSGTFAPALFQVFTIIDNDGSNPLDTTAPGSGLVPGSIVTVDGKTLRLYYNGGDGNDVVLVSANGTPTTLYINDDWTVPGLVDGDLEQSGTQTAYIGIDAFTSIGAALAAYPGFAGTIIVNAGNYAADTVNLTGFDVDLHFVQGPSTLASLSTDGNDSVALGGVGTGHTVPATLTLGSGGTINAPVSGLGGLTLSAGTLALAGSNSYAGTTTVNAGTLSLSGGAAIVDTGAVVLNGGTLDLGGSETIGNLTGLAGSAVTLNAHTLTTGDATTTTHAGTISGSGSLVKQGNGTFTLAAANSHAGTTTVNAGVLNLHIQSATGSINPLGTSTLVVNDTARVIVSQGAPAPLGTANNLSMSWFNTGAASSLITDIGNNTPTGGLLGTTPQGTKLLSGAINFGNDAAFQTSTTSPLTGSALTAGDNYMFLYRGTFTPSVTGTYQFGVGNQVGSINIDDEAAIYLDRNGDGLFSTATGERVAYTAVVGSNAGSTVSLTAGVAYPIAIAYRESTGNAIMIANVQRSAGAPTVAWTNINSSTGSGVGSFNTYVVPNNIQFAANPVSVSGTAAIELQVPGISFGALSAAAGSTLNLDATAAGVNNIVTFASATLAGAATINTNAAHAAITGIVGQTVAAQVIKGGANTLLLSGANTYAGATTVSAGTLRLGNNLALGAVTAGTTVSAGATVDFNGFRAGVDGNEPLFVEGAGVGGQGVLVNTRNSGTLTMARNVTLTGNATFGSPVRWDIRDDGADPVTFDMNGFTLTKVGGAELCLVQTVISDPGSVNVNTGIFRLEGSTNFGGSGTITVGVSGATLDFWNNSQTHPVNVSLASGANLTTNGGGGPTVAGTVTLNGTANFGLNNNLTLTGQVTGAGGLNKNNGGTLTLTSNSNDYAGLTTIGGGTVVATVANALGSTGQGTHVASGTTLRYDATAGPLAPAAETLALNGGGVSGLGALQSVGNDVTLSSSILLQGTTTLASNTANRTLTLNGSLTRDGAGDITLLGAGNFDINADIASTTAYTLSPITGRAFNGVQQDIGSVTVITNDLNGTTVPTRTATLNGPLSFLNAAAFNALFNTPTAIPLVDNFTTVFETTLTVLTAGIYTFSVTNNDDGAAVWLKPTAQVGFGIGDRLQGIVGNSNTAVATKLLGIGTYTLVYAHREGGGGESVVGRIAGPAALGVSNATLLPVVDPSLTTSHLIKTGTGTATLSGDNSYTGVTLVHQGVLVADSNNALGSASPVTAPTLVAGPLNQHWQLGTDNGSTSEFSLENGSSNAAPGSATARDDDWYFAGTYPATIGTLAADEATGGGPATGFERALTGGDPTDRIHFNLTADQLDDNYQLQIDLVGSSFTGGSIPIQVLVNGVVVHIQTITADGLVTTPVFNGASVNAVTGDNVVTITRTTGTGTGQWVQFDYIRLNRQGVVNGSADTQVESGATLALTGGISTAESLRLNGTGASGQPGALSSPAGTNSVSGTVTLLSNTRIDVGAGASLALNSTVSGTASLTKIGAGTLVLGAANSYDGGSAVNGGTLLVNGSLADSALADDVVVASGATLGGSGTINGHTLVQSGGRLAPGTSPGVIAHTDLTLAAGAHFDVDLWGITVGSGYDQAVVSNAVSLGGANLNLQFGSGPFVPAAGDEFVIVLNNGPNAVTGTFVGLLNNAMFVQGGNRFGIRYDADAANLNGSGNDVVLYALPAAATPATLYVNDDWAGSSPFTEFDGDLETAAHEASFYTYDAFSSISDALAAYPAFVGTIIVNSGSYTESIDLTGEDVDLRFVQGPSSLVALSADGNDSVALGGFDVDHPTAATLTPGTGGTINAPVSGTGGLTLIGGTMVLGVANTYTGATTLNGGVLQIAAEDRLGGDPGAFNASQLTLNGGTLTATADFTIDDINRGITIGAGGGSISTNSQTLTINSIIAGNGTLTKIVSPGMLVLGGNNASYSGDIVVNAGTLRVTHSNALGNTIGKTTVNYDSTGVVGGEGVILNVLGSGLNVAEPLVMNATATGGFRTTLSNNTGTNTWSGPITLQGSGVNNCTINSGALEINGTVTGDTGYSGMLFARGPSAGGYGRFNNTVNLGAGTFARTDVALWILNASGNAWASMTIATGTLRTDVSNALPAGVIVNMGQAASAPILDLNGTNQTVAGINTNGGASGTLIVSNSSATPSLLTVNNPTNVSYSGQLSGNLTLAKTGAGTQTLTGGLAGGTSTFTALEVDAGTVAITGVTYNITTGIDLDAGTLTVTGGTVNAGTVTNSAGAGFLDLQNGTMTVTSGFAVDNLRVGFESTAAARTASLTVADGAVAIGTGSGTLDIARSTSGGGAVVVGTVDLTGADSVTISTGDLRVGTMLGNPNGAGTKGTLLLSNTSNSVTATNVILGDSPGSGNSGTVQVLTLGAGSNTFDVDTFRVGAQKSDASVTIAAGGTFTLDGRTGAATDLYIGWNNAVGTGAITNAVVNLTGGTFNATLDELVLGRHGGGAGGGKGTLTMATGTVTANSLILADSDFGGSSSANANTAGTLNLNGGTLTVNGTISDGDADGSATGNAQATINLNGGTLQFQTLQRSSATSSFAFNFNSGTLQNAPGASATVQNLTVDLPGAAAHNFVVDAGQTMTVQTSATLANAGGLAKSGDGTLVLAGAHTYAGGTTLSAGTLLVNNANGSGTGSGNVAVNGGVLGGVGTIAGSVTVNATGTITGGTLGGVGTLTVGGLTFNGGTYQADLAGNSSDTLVTGGTIDLNGGTAGAFTLSPSGSTNDGVVFTLINNTAAGAILDPSLTGALEGASTTVNGKTAHYTYSGGDGNNFTLTVLGDPLLSGSGNLELRRVTSGSLDNLQLLQGGVILDSRPLASVVASYTVNGGAGADTLTVNYTTTSPASGYFQRDVFFNGNGGSNGLVVSGGSFGRVAYTYANATDSSLAQYQDAAGTTLLSTITSTGVSSIVSSSTVTDQVFTLPGAANLAELLDQTGGVSRLRSNNGTFSQTDFVNPGSGGTITLNGHAAAGNDSITVTSLDAAYAGSLAINGQAGSDTVTLAGALTLGGSLAVTAETVNLNNTIAATSTVAINGTGKIGASISVAGSAVTFNGILDDDGNALTGSALTVNSSGTTTFGGAVGNLAPLASVTTDAGGTTAINGGQVATTGAQTYHDNVTLGTGTTLAGTTITTNGTLAGNGHSLAISGNAVFGDAAADTVTGLTTLSVSGTTAINTSNVTGTGSQTYSGAVTLGTSTTLDAGSGNVLFSSTVNGGHGLTVNSSGTTTFGGAVGGVSALSSVTTNAGGTTVINGSQVATTGAQTYHDAVTLGATTVLDAGTSAAITFDSTLNGSHNLTLYAGTITAAGAVGATAALGSGTFAAITVATGSAEFLSTVRVNSGIVTSGSAPVVFRDDVTVLGGVASKFDADVTLDGLTFLTATDVTFGDTGLGDTLTHSTAPVTIQTATSGRTLTFNSKVSGPSDLTLTLPASAIVYNNAANDHSGTTTIKGAGTTVTVSSAAKLLDVTGAATAGELILDAANVMLHGDGEVQRQVRFTANGDNGIVRALTIANVGGTGIRADNGASALQIGQSGLGVQVKNSLVGLDLVGTAASYGATTATVIGSTFQDNTTGVRVENATITVGLNNVINGGTDGLLLTGLQADVTGLALNNLAFSGQNGVGESYVRLEQNALAGPRTLNASSATFDGDTGSAMTALELANLELNLHHYPDNNGVGLIFVKTNYVAIDNGNLLVFGSDAVNNVSINTNVPTDVKVSLNGLMVTNPLDPQGKWDLSGEDKRVIVFALGGNDFVQVTGNIQSELRGGQGNDSLYGGNNTDVLYGDEGNDTLVGGNGHDVLIGGAGRDNLQGGAGNDLLLGGAITPTSPLNTYNYLRDEALPTANTPATLDVIAAAVLDGTTINDYDTLSGGLGADGFIAYFSGTGIRDLLTDFNATQGDASKNR